MEIAAENEILGTLPENTLKLLKETTEMIGRVKYNIGELETQKHLLLKDMDDMRYNLKVEEQKIIKRYGEGAIIDIRTGNILAPAKTSVMESLKNVNS